MKKKFIYLKVSAAFKTWILLKILVGELLWEFFSGIRAELWTLKCLFLYLIVVYI